MDNTARERGLSGISRLGEWTPEDSDAYEQAHDLINQLIAAYSARIASMDEPEAGQLRAEQHQHVEARRHLTVTDRDAVRRVREEYPGLIRDLRGE